MRSTPTWYGIVWRLIIPLLLLSVSSMPLFSASPSVVTERWGAHATAEYTGNLQDTTLTAIYPDATGGTGDELVIRSGGGYDGWALLYFDVSNLPPGTVVRYARLHLWLFSHVPPLDTWEPVHQILDPDGLGLWSESQATFDERRSGVPWSNSGTRNLTTVIGPQLDRVYLGNLPQWNYTAVEWNVTSAVQAWVGQPAANQGLLLPHVPDGLYTIPSRENADSTRRPYLEITYEGPNPNRPAQVTGVQAFHRSGQTFITWHEIASGNPEERYRVYRHTAPITADNLDQATLLAEVPQNSGYFKHEVEGCSSYAYGGACSPISQSRFIIQDDGTPLPEGVGLFVYTANVGQVANLPYNSVGQVTNLSYYYYAVTSVVEGNENRQDFGTNTNGPLTESASTPRPVRVWTNATNTGWVYTQFMDYHAWNPHFEGYAYNFYVGVPAGYSPDGPALPLLVQLHAYTGTYRLPASPGSGGTDYEWPAVQVFPDDRSNTWWFGYGQNVGTNQPLYAAPIVDYTHQHLEQFCWRPRRHACPLRNRPAHH